LSSNQELSFEGAEFVQELDGARLTGQIARVYAVVKDEKERSVDEIQEEILRRFKVCDPTPSISAQLRNLRKPEFGGHLVRSFRKEGGLFVYVLIRDYFNDEATPRVVKDAPLVEYSADGKTARLTVLFVEKPKWLELDAKLRGEGFDYRGHGIWKK
jgi:hypothetical protein